MDRIIKVLVILILVVILIYICVELYARVMSVDAALEYLEFIQDKLYT